MKRILLLLALIPLSAEAVSVRYNLAANFDGTRNTAYPAGNKPDAGGDSPPAGWTAVDVEAVTPTYDMTASVKLYNSSATEWTVGATGGRVFGTDDSFAAFSYERTGDVTLTARVTQASQNVNNSKGGIMVRDSTDADAASCFLSVFGSSGTLIGCRPTTGGSVATAFFDGGPAITLPDCFRVSVDADSDLAKFYQATTATDCSAASYTELYTMGNAFLGGTFNLMLATTPTDPSSAGVSATTVFDQVVVNTGSVNHSPGAVGFSPTSYSVDEDAGTVTLTVVRTGPGTGAVDLTATVNNGTAVAGTDFTSPSCNFDFADADVADNTCNITITDRDGVTQGNTQFTVVLTKNSGSDTLENATATITIVDKDAGESFSANTESFTGIVQDCSAPACDWDLSGKTFQYYHVTSNSTGSGPGTYADAVTGSWPSNVCRVVLFDAQMTIRYSNSPPNATALVTTSDCLLEIGQSSGGVMILNRERVLRGDMWLGWHMTYGYDEALFISDGYVENTGDNIRAASGADHIVCMNCTLLWNSDESFSTTGGAVSATFYQSLSAESSKLSNSKCILAQSGVVDVIRSSCVVSGGRNPLVKTDGGAPTSSGSMVNSIVYYPSNAGVRMDALFQYNVEENYFIAGGTTTTGAAFRLDPGTNAASRLWRANNIGINGFSNPPSVLNNASASNLASSRITASFPTGTTLFDISTVSNAAGLQLITSCLGAQPTNRIATTQRIIDIILSQGSSGVYIDDPSEVGGAPTLTFQPAPQTGLPSNPNAAGTHINAFMDWAMQESDARLPAGRGCT